MERKSEERITNQSHKANVCGRVSRFRPRWTFDDQIVAVKNKKRSEAAGTGGYVCILRAGEQ